MLTPEEVTLLQEELSTSKNPLYFYDDDPDGLCSFLLLYRHYREGRGVMIKTAPKITPAFLPKVEEHNPDKVFILDMPIVEQDFIDKVKKPIFWIDHHAPVKAQKVRYFNPLVHNPHEYTPTTRLVYQITNEPEDLWIAVVGCFGDYYLPDFIDDFIQKYPALLPKKMDLAEMVFKQPIGTLVRIFSFLLKGPTSEVNKCVKILTRITSPEEILEQKTSAGKYLYKHYEMINQKYVPLFEAAKKQAGKDKLLLFYYTEDKWSFTSELANEFSALHPNKVILIAREKSGEMKCSLRSKNPILPALEKALVGVEGYGGGHPVACGAVIKKEDWEKFLGQFRKEI